MSSSEYSWNGIRLEPKLASALSSLRTADLSSEIRSARLQIRQERVGPTAGAKPAAAPSAAAASERRAGGEAQHAPKRRAVASSDGLVAQAARAPEGAPRIRHRKERMPPTLSAKGATGTGDKGPVPDLPPDQMAEFEAGNNGVGPATPSAKPVMRDRLRDRLPAWREWVANPLVLSWVEDGFPLRWEKDDPPPAHFGRNHPSAEQHAAFVDQAIADLLAAKSICKVSRKPHMVCPLGVVERGPKLRLIWDGRPVNEHLCIPKFQYEDLRVVPGFLLPNDWTYTLDYSSGYHHINVHPDYWDYLGFCWRGKFYVFTQLPFGLASACWAFTKVTREVMRGFRRLGWRCSSYLDDQIHADQDPDRLVRRRAAVLQRLEGLGFVVNREKSLLGPPSQCVRYLGMLVDTKRGVFEVPADKRERVLAAIDSALSARRSSARELASVKGQLVSMSWAFGPWSRLKTRGLGELIETRRSWSTHLALSEDARDELTFWRTCFDRFNGTRPLWKATQVYSIIHADAAGRSPLSNGGWGAWTVLDQQMAVARGPWDSNRSRLGSTPQELQAILDALQSFCLPAGLDGHTVRVITDNLNAANIINKGSARADSCHAVACELQWFCVERSIDLQAEWRPRTLNQVADLWSKLVEPDDWQLDPNAFSQLNGLWGPFDIDLFASHLNNHLPAYYSRHFTPDTTGVDAFRFKWGRRCWANPPFGLLLRVLQHARACQARLCLIAPLWPTKDWWPFLTGDGKAFKPFVHGVRLLGRAADLLVAGDSRPLPKGAANWSLMALLVDFARPSPQLIRIPTDAPRTAPQMRR